MCSRQMDFPTVRIISFQLWGPSWRNTEIWVILWYKKLSQSHDLRNRTENFVLTKHKYSTWAGVLTQEDAKFERSPLAEDDFPPGDLLVNYIFEPCTCISPKCFILLIEWIRSQRVDFYSAERLCTITRCYQGLKMICFYLKCSSEFFFFKSPDQTDLKKKNISFGSVHFTLQRFFSTVLPVYWLIINFLLVHIKDDLFLQVIQVQFY